MAKESGIVWSLAIDDSGGVARSIENDIGNVDFATPRGVHDVTGLDKTAMERLLLLADFSITINGFFNDASNTSHDVFKSVSSTSVARTVTIGISGQSLPNETYFTDYSLSRASTGELSFTSPGVLTGGVVPTWA